MLSWPAAHFTLQILQRVLIASSYEKCNHTHDLFGLAITLTLIWSVDPFNLRLLFTKHWHYKLPPPATSGRSLDVEHSAVCGQRKLRGTAELHAVSWPAWWTLVCYLCCLKCCLCIKLGYCMALISLAWKQNQSSVTWDDGLLLWGCSGDACQHDFTLHSNAIVCWPGPTDSPIFHSLKTTQTSMVMVLFDLYLQLLFKDWWCFMTP